MAERIGPGCCPVWLWNRLLASVAADDGWARWAAKGNEPGRSVWRFEIPEGVFWVVMDAKEPITIYAPGMSLRVRKKGPLHKRRKRL